MGTLRLALAQINSAVGNFNGNLRKIVAAIEQAKSQDADIIAFPELAITGYPPEDLLFQSHFIQENLKTLQKVVRQCSCITAVVGFVDQRDTLKNAAAVIHEREIKFIYHKHYLPNYGVFDEARYFQPGTETPVFTLKGTVIGINICEDIWQAEGPASVQAIEGRAELIINISASPYRIGVSDLREKMLRARATDHHAIIGYVNSVGGQDELVFDGASLIVSEQGKIVARAEAFCEQLLMADISLSPVAQMRRKDARWNEKQSLPLSYDFSSPAKTRKKKRIAPVLSKKMTQTEAIYKALLLGLSDYVRKNGFKKVFIALSGGIDSALTATLAVDALGAQSVTGVFMPSRYTSKESYEDVGILRKNIGIDLIHIPIEPVFCAYLKSLSDLFSEYPVDTTEENLQSRIRGTMIMALSNKWGGLVITTGNKSEMSVGYATLYGDMAGGFALIKDVWKTEVYRLARYCNKRRVMRRSPAAIPKRILTRPPTAELRPNQMDQDTLPPYVVLDPILAAYLENDQSIGAIVRMGFDRDTVARVIRMADGAEFKRRQAPVGVKITGRGLGKDRRMPVTNCFRPT